MYNPSNTHIKNDAGDAAKGYYESIKFVDNANYNNMNA